MFPNPRALAVAQDRLAEKTLFRELGIPVPAFAAIDFARGPRRRARARSARPASSRRAASATTARASSASRRRADADAAWDALGAQARTVGLILEGFVPFERELSVVAVRGRDGEFRTWPLTENWHVDGVLSASLAPAQVDAGARSTRRSTTRARSPKRSTTSACSRSSCSCRDGELLANEMAPRVHNSGHWTIEGSETSQFQNHLRAVLGLPLGDTRMVGHACMLNWIGEMPDANAGAARSPAATGTTTARRRAPGARSATRRCARIRRKRWRDALQRVGDAPWAARRRSRR